MACTGLRFHWYKKRESVKLWCRGCNRCAAGKAGSTKKRKAALSQESLFVSVGIYISGPYNVSSSGSKYIPIVSISPSGLRPN